MSGPRDLVRAGELAIIAGTAFFAGTFFAQVFYPGYSVSANYISDLGATCHRGLGTTPCFVVQPSAAIFSVTLVLHALLTMASAVLVYRALRKRLFATVYGLYGFGSSVAGTFSERHLSAHGAGAALIILCGILFLLMSSRAVPGADRRLRRLFLVLGLVAMAGVVPTFSTGSVLIGPGAWERLVIYPIVIGQILSGARLLGTSAEGVPIPQAPGAARRN